MMEHILIRNYLNKMTALTESVGLANRKTGDVFINAAGDSLTFIGISFFPESGKFDDFTDLDSEVKRIEKRHTTTITFVNERKANTLAFGIVTMKDLDGASYLYGRYFTNISHIKTQNNWPNNGIPGFKLNIKNAVKMTAGMMPQDILTQFDSLSIDNILNQVVKKFGPTHPLTHLTNAVAKGQSLPIYIDISKNPDLQFEAIRDYFCEILQPIAIINGLADGNAAEAEKDFLGKGGFKSCKITFDTATNNGLWDSLLINSKGQEIKISTKGASGAKASIKNLTNAVKDLRTANRTDLIDEHSSIVEIIEIVDKGGYIHGPLNLAIKFNMISQKEANLVSSMKSKLDVQLTKNLQKMYDTRQSGATGDIVPFYNMLAAIAYRVADYVNDQTNFGEAAAAILNNGALIQVNTSASEKDGKFILNKFHATYPSTAVSNVTFSAQKTYWSGGNKGNFTFKIGKNDEVEDNPVSISDIDDTTDELVAKVLAPKMKLRPPGSTEPPTVDSPRAKRAEPAREKRK